MATLRWTRENTFADNRRDVTARGQGEYDVPDDAVEEYLDHPSGGWERPDESDSDGEADAETDDDGEADTEDADEDEDEFDAEAFVDRTPMSTVVEDIEAGEADDHLDAVEEAADRQGVRDAVADRRDELDTEQEG